MRYLATLLISIISSHAVGQACLLPESMNILRPEKCGIRYVKSDGNEIKVILEFEKEARIITPDNPDQVKGKAVDLTGVYFLTYDHTGKLLSESRSFLQKGDIPEKGLIFGLNGQRGDLIEYDIDLISQEQFDSIPWVAVKSSNTRKSVAVVRDSFFQTELNIDKHNRIVNIDVIQYHRNDRDHTRFDPTTETYDLMLYDSADTKRYWTSVYMPTYDSETGTTLAMLNEFDKKTSKLISEKRWRLVAFDSLGRDTGYYDWSFDLPMDIAYRSERLCWEGDELAPLDRQIWAFMPKTQAQRNGHITYNYYEFDKYANLILSSQIVTGKPVFNTINHLWLKQGVLYVSNDREEVNICHIDRKGKSQIYSTGNRLPELRDLIAKRMNQGNHAISLSLAQDATIFADSTILMIYNVQENVGVGASLGLAETSRSTMVNHGLVVLHIEPHGNILAAKYYQRPENADPRATVVLGPVDRNDEGQISFYAYETTSIGTYPVLYTIRRGNVSIMKNDKGATASRFIYFDSDEGIVSYFGLIKDPDDPRNSVRTVEVLRDDED